MKVSTIKSSLLQGGGTGIRWVACLVVEAHAVEDVPDVLSALCAVRQAAIRWAILAVCTPHKFVITTLQVQKWLNI
jgi:hypothetical protein